jgi:hypothetical protein
MQFGDVVFERGKGPFAAAITLAQRVLPGKDPRITHALIVVRPGLAVQAGVKHGVHFRTFDKASDFDDILYVMRPKALEHTDENRQRALARAGIEAFLAFVGEKYSFGQILLYKFDNRLANDMAETCGATFCSALVKRVLTVAGLTETLSKTLLMSPSELHAELSTSLDWAPVSLDDFRRTLRGPSATDLAWAEKLQLRSDLGKIGAEFNKKNRLLVEGYTKLLAVQDATARATLELSRINLLHNVFYPYDMIEEAGAALWWNELGKLIGRARWTIAASQSVYEAERERLANRIRSAAPRVLEAMRQDDPNRMFFEEFEALLDEGDIEEMTRFGQRIEPFLMPGVAELYSDARDVLAKADDRVLQELAQAIEVRLNSISGIEDIAQKVLYLLYGDPKKA